MLGSVQQAQSTTGADSSDGFFDPLAVAEQADRDRLALVVHLTAIADGRCKPTPTQEQRDNARHWADRFAGRSTVASCLTQRARSGRTRKVMIHSGGDGYVEAR